MSRRPIRTEQLTDIYFLKPPPHNVSFTQYFSDVFLMAQYFLSGAVIEPKQEPPFPVESMF